MAKGESGLVNAIAEAFIAACRDEIEAPKPGNVHVFADGHGMTVSDFLRSAEAAAPALSNPSLPVGARILAAVEATFAAAGMNTNLGIILLCAPLAAAAETGEDLHTALRKILAGLTLADADFAFRAILHASPAGLGTAARHDVRGNADVTLLEAMREAAGRDGSRINIRMILWMYLKQAGALWLRRGARAGPPHGRWSAFISRFSRAFLIAISCANMGLMRLLGCKPRHGIC